MAMKNKTKMWRKLAEKREDGMRTGKMIRNILRNQANTKAVLPIHIWLLKRAGIATPKFDAANAKADTNTSNDITDVEFTEGALA